MTPYVAGVAYGVEVYERELRDAKRLRFDPRGILATDCLARLRAGPIHRLGDLRPLSAHEGFKLLCRLQGEGWVECVEVTRGHSVTRYWRLVEGAELPPLPDYTGAPPRKDLEGIRWHDRNPVKPHRRKIEPAVRVVRVRG